METNVDKLVQELQDNRKKLQQLSLELEDLTTNVKDLLPQKYDFRTRFVLEDKIKYLTQLFDTILKFRSEISKLLEKEIEIMLEIYQESNEDLVKKVSAISPKEIESIIKKAEGIVSELQSELTK